MGELPKNDSTSNAARLNPFHEDDMRNFNLTVSSSQCSEYSVTAESFVLRDRHYTLWPQLRPALDLKVPKTKTILVTVFVRQARFSQQMFRTLADGMEPSLANFESEEWISSFDVTLEEEENNATLRREEGDEYVGFSVALASSAKDEFL